MHIIEDFGPTLAADFEVICGGLRYLKQDMRTFAGNVGDPVFGLAVSFDEVSKINGLALSTKNKAIFFDCQNINPVQRLLLEGNPLLVAFNMAPLTLCLWRDVRFGVTKGIDLSTAFTAGRVSLQPGQIIKRHLDCGADVRRIDSLWECVETIGNERRKACLQAWLAFRSLILPYSGNPRQWLT